MKRLVVKDHLVVLNLGTVERDDIIVQMADFCLQFEGVSWAAVAGKLGSKLVISVRNYGMSGHNAGEVVKNLFGDIGSAGGHRNMSKAVIPLRAWRRREGTTRDANRNAPARVVRHGRQTLAAERRRARAGTQWQLTGGARRVHAGVYRFRRFPYRK